MLQYSPYQAISMLWVVLWRIRYCDITCEDEEVCNCRKIQWIVQQEEVPTRKTNGSQNSSEKLLSRRQGALKSRYISCVFLHFHQGGSTTISVNETIGSKWNSEYLTIPPRYFYRGNQQCSIISETGRYKCLKSPRFIIFERGRCRCLTFPDSGNRRIYTRYQISGVWQRLGSDTLGFSCLSKWEGMKLRYTSDIRNRKVDCPGIREVTLSWGRKNNTRGKNEFRSAIELCEFNCGFQGKLVKVKWLIPGNQIQIGLKPAIG